MALANRAGVREDILLNPPRQASYPLVEAAAGDPVIDIIGRPAPLPEGDGRPTQRMPPSVRAPPRASAGVIASFRKAIPQTTVKIGATLPTTATWLASS